MPVWIAVLMEYPHGGVEHFDFFVHTQQCVSSRRNVRMGCGGGVVGVI